MNKEYTPLKKFDADAKLTEIAMLDKEFTPMQIIGILIVSMHEHYLEEHQKVLTKLHGTRNDPIYLTRVIENNLRAKYDLDKEEFVKVETPSMILQR